MGAGAVIARAILALGLIAAYAAAQTKLPGGVVRYDKAGTASPSFWQHIQQEWGWVVSSRPFGRSIAFLVGVGNYQYIDPKLRYVADDLKEMREFLLDAAGFDTVYVLQDAADVNLVEDYMSNGFPTPLRAEDRLLFYFSGHGTDRAGTGYLQFAKAQPGRYDATQYLDVTRCERWSRQIPAKHILFLIDACNSGLGFDAKPGDAPRIDTDLVSLFSGDGSRVVMTAGTGNEKSFQVGENNRGGYSVFTRAFLDAIRHTQSANGFLILDEVMAALRRNVMEFSRGNAGRQMTPRLWQIPREPGKDKGTFVFINPRVKTPPVPQPLKQFVNVRSKERDYPALPLLTSGQGGGSHQALLLNTALFLNRGVDASSQWTPNDQMLIQSFESASGWGREVSRLLVPFRSLVGPTLSADGRYLVACSSQMEVVVISLSDGRVAKKVSLGGRASELDSCSISVSADGRYAVVSAKPFDSPTHLFLISLSEVKPSFSLPANASRAIFVASSLVTTDGQTVRITDVATGGAREMEYAAGPVVDVLADAEGTGFALRSKEEISWHELGSIDSSPGSASMPVPAKANCSPGRDWVRCSLPSSSPAFLTGATLPSVPRGRVSFGSCIGEACKFFPSALPSNATWPMLSMGDQLDELILEGIGRIRESRFHLPEKVALARLLSSGEVVSVGMDGGVFRLSRSAYFDCCRLRTSDGDPTRVGSGNDGVTAVLGVGGRLGIFLNRDPVAQITLAGVDAASQMVWSQDSKVLAVINVSQTKLLHFDGGDLAHPRVISVPCGGKVALDPSGGRLACLDSNSGEIRTWDAKTGAPGEGLASPSGPKTALFASNDSWILVGWFGGRPIIRLSVWPIRGGAGTTVDCPVDTTWDGQPLAVLQHSTVVARDGQSLIGIDARTCTLRFRQEVPPVARIAGASNADQLAVPWPGGRIITRGDQSASPFLPWKLEDEIDDLSISPDGSHVVVLAGRHLMRIPVSLPGFIELIRGSAPRDLTESECRQYLANQPCPKIRLQ